MVKVCSSGLSPEDGFQPDAVSGTRVRERKLARAQSRLLVMPQNFGKTVENMRLDNDVIPFKIL